jgi:hypothetical protein
MVGLPAVDLVGVGSNALGVQLPPPYSSAAPDDNVGVVSKASRRLRALAALSGSLTDTLTAGEAAVLAEVIGGLLARSSLG